MVDGVIMPEAVSIGFSGGPTFATDKLQLATGFEKRLQNRALAVHRYTFSYEDKPAATVIAAKAFFYGRRGDFKAFLFKDWTDFAATAELLGTGDGSNKDFQARRVYTDGANPYVRTIRHLKSGTLVVKLDGVTKTIVTDYTVSASGLVSFVTAPTAAALVTADFQFYVPVRFDGDAFQSQVPYRSLDAMSIAGLAVVEVLE